MTISDWTDSSAWLDTSTRILERNTWDLSNWTCTSYAWWTQTTFSSYPNVEDTWEITQGKCYKYRWLVSDNVWNEATTTWTNEFKVDVTVPNTEVDSLTETSPYIFFSAWDDNMYYKSTWASINFTLNTNSTDPESWIEKVNFPYLWAWFTWSWDDLSSPYTNDYSILASTTASSASNTITWYNNAWLSNTDNFAVTYDWDSPISVSVTCPSSYDSDWTFNLTGSVWSDNWWVWIDTSNSYFQKRAWTLSWDTCDFWSNEFANTGSPNASNLWETSISKWCYEYRYYSVDLVWNETTSSSCIIKVDKDWPSISITWVTETSDYTYYNWALTTLYYNNTLTATSSTITVSLDISDLDTWVDTVTWATSDAAFWEIPNDNTSPYELTYTLENWESCTNPITIRASNTIWVEATANLNCVSDTTGPTATININAWAQTSQSTGVTLNNTYSDAASWVKECRYKNGWDDWSENWAWSTPWTAWETCNTSKAWTLVWSTWEKTIYYELKDNTNNITQKTDTIELWAGFAPTATWVSITWTVTWTQLIWTYTFDDPEFNPEWISTYKWFRSNTLNWTYTQIPWAFSTWYTLQAWDDTKYFKFQVIPVSTILPYQWTQVSSSIIWPSYTMEVWPHSILPEGDITAYSKVWINWTATTVYDIIIELRKATCNQLIETNGTISSYITHEGQENSCNQSVSTIHSVDDAVTQGSYSTRLDWTFWNATYSSLFTNPPSDQWDLRLVAYAYDADYNLIASTVHNDFTPETVINPVVTINTFTTPTSTSTQSIAWTLIESNFEQSDTWALVVSVNNWANESVDQIIVNWDDWDYNKLVSLTEWSNIITVTATDKSWYIWEDTKTIILDTVSPLDFSIYEVKDSEPTTDTQSQFSTSGKARISWTNSSDVSTSISKYIVYRKATPTPSTATGQTPWEDYDFMNASWDLGSDITNWVDTWRASNTVYTYKVVAYDWVNLTKDSSTWSITVDTEYPWVTIISPTSTTSTWSQNITISANYWNTFLVNCHIKKDNWAWIDMTWDNAQSWTALYTFNSLTDWTYDFTVQCWDEARLYSSDTVESITVDTSLPTAFVEISSNSLYTTSTWVTLDLSYWDNNWTWAIAECRYQNSWDAWSNWETCNNTKSWTLSGSYWLKTVNYEVKDNAWNIAQSSDTIFYRAQNKPVATNVTAEWMRLVWETINGSYKYTDIDWDKQWVSTFRWLSSNTWSWPYTQIPWETTINYTLTWTDQWKYIKFEVTPISSTWDPDTWTAVLSTSFGKIQWLAAKKDYTASWASIALDSQAQWTVELPQDTTIVVLWTGQKLEFESALDTSSSTAEISSWVTIQQALNDVLWNWWFTWTSIESVSLDSWIEWEPIVLASTDNLQVEIPDNTNIYAPPEWDWTIAPPQDITDEVTAESWKTIQWAISIWSSNVSLIFDSAVKVTIPSPDWLPFYSNNWGTTWISIDTQCNDVFWTGLTFPNECYFKTETTTIVWTYHFTDLAVIEDTEAPTIISSTMAPDNSYIDITFSEPVYWNSELSTWEWTWSLTVNDLWMIYSWAITDASITNLTNTWSGPLVWWEEVIRVHVDISWIPVSYTVLVIYEAASNTIFDLAWNPLTNQTAYTQLNNAPKISWQITLSSQDSLVWTQISWSYAYLDYESDPQWTSTFKWYRQDTATWIDSLELIAWATSSNYTIQESDTDKYIYLEVTPVASTGYPLTWPSKLSITPIWPITVWSFQDHSSNPSTTINLNTSGPQSWIAQFNTWRTDVKLDTDQYLSFSSALVTKSWTTTKVWTTSIKDALTSITNSVFLDANIKSIKLRSWIVWQKLKISSTDNIEVEMEDETNIYAPDTWDWSIKAPEDITSTVSWSLSQWSTANSAISVWADWISLLFDKKAKITLPTASGKPYYSIDWNSWTPITTECTDSTWSGLIFPNECFIHTWSLTIVWTYHFTRIADISDSTAPTILSSTLAQDNSYIDITFSESIYWAETWEVALEASDFLLTFTQNGWAATDTTLTSITNTWNTSLVWWEEVIRVNIEVTWTPTWEETVEIQASTWLLIFDASWNPASPTIPTTWIKTLRSAPKATSLSISWTLTEWETVNWTYTYSDTDWDLQWTSIYKWYTTVAQSGSPLIAISWEESQSYTLTDTDANKYIVFEVTPVAASGYPLTWASVQSLSSWPILSNTVSDYSTNTWTLNINLTNVWLGTMQLPTWKDLLRLHTTQKLKFSTYLQNKAADTLEPTNNGITIEQALNTKMWEWFTWTLAKSIILQTDTLEDITISSTDNLDVIITHNTTVYAASSWSWTIAPPKNITSTTTYTWYIAKSVVFVWDEDQTLMLDKPAKVTLSSSQWNAYYNNWQDWISIPTCQAWTTSWSVVWLTFPNECSIRIWAEIIVWTYHFTEFWVFNEETWEVAASTKVKITWLAITHEAPGAMSFTAAVATSWDRTFEILSDYFWITDMKASNSWFTAQVWMTDLTAQSWALTIPASNLRVKVTSTWVINASWSVIPEVTVPAWASSWYTAFTSWGKLTVIERTEPSWWLIWKFWVKLSIQIDVPEYTSPWLYQWTLIFDLLDN